MTTTVLASASTTVRNGADAATRFGKMVLLINGTLLLAVSLVASLGDLAGHFLDIGPFAASHFGNPDAIAYLEAHGLALIAAILMLVNRNAAGPAWNWTAATLHLLLGGANLCSGRRSRAMAWCRWASSRRPCTECSCCSGGRRILRGRLTS